jgi:lipid II:glycine glycyltransferase (peptidoglycan interpeptide bridge formation enzyme)
MIIRYKELMKAHDFTGIPVDVLNSLRTHSAKYSPLIIIRGMCDDSAVAGICIALHGCSATYLIGWNGLTGRSSKANQFVIWQSIIYLKQLGVKWFDLGGIDEEKTPGIAAFKRGLRGAYYELVGEYWKW